MTITTQWKLRYERITWVNSLFPDFFHAQDLLEPIFLSGMMLKLGPQWRSVGLQKGRGTRHLRHVDKAKEQQRSQGDPSKFDHVRHLPLPKGKCKKGQQNPSDVHCRSHWLQEGLNQAFLKKFFLFFLFLLRLQQVLFAICLRSLHAHKCGFCHIILQWYHLDLLLVISFFSSQILAPACFQKRTHTHTQGDFASQKCCTEREIKIDLSYLTVQDVIVFLHYDHARIAFHGQHLQSPWPLLTFH